MDIFSLLQRELAPGSEAAAWDQGMVERRRIDRNFPNWLSGFCIYVGVLLQAHPHRGAVLFQYLDIIHRIFTEHVGNAWMDYDKVFRSYAANNPALDWGRVQMELWIFIVAPARRIQGDYSNSGHLITRGKGTGPWNSQGRHRVQCRHVRWEFNQSGATSNLLQICRVCGMRFPSCRCPCFEPEEDE